MTHQTSKKLFLILLILLMISLTGCICNHEWDDATCTEPKTCSICDKTEGEPLGHDSEWGEWYIDYEEAANIQELYCVQCEEVIDTKSELIDTFILDDYFTIFPHAFAGRFEELSSNSDFSVISEFDDYAIYHEDNVIYYRIQDRSNDYEDIGLINFTKPDGTTVAVMDDFTENSIGCINILIEDSYDVPDVVYSAIRAIDPSIFYSRAEELEQEIVDSMFVAVGNIEEKDIQGIDYNGINYLLYKDRDYHYLLISVSSL